MLLRRLFEHLKDQNWFAVGLDLVVVVVGIFLAFQVERWYSEQLLREEARERLSQVLEDFAYNERVILQSISSRARVVGAALNLLDMDQRGASASDSGEFYRQLAAASITLTPRFSRGAYDVLIATGEIDLLEDPELRNSLSDFHARMDEFMVFNQGMWLVDRNTFEPYVIQNLDHIAMLQYVHPTNAPIGLGIAQMRPNQESDAFIRVLGNSEFEGVLGAKWHATRDELVRLQRMLSRMPAIRSQLKSSLDDL